MSILLTYLQNYWFLLILCSLSKIIDTVVIPCIMKHSNEPPPFEALRHFKQLTVTLFLSCVCTFFITIYSDVAASQDAPSGFPKTHSQDSTASTCAPSPTTILDDSMAKIDSLIKLGSIEYLDYELLKSLSTEELYLLKNGLFAFEGRCFVTPELTEYFQSFYWYRGEFSESEFLWSYLNIYQQANIIQINNIESERSCN